MREVGYRARGGVCRLRDSDMVIIDRDQAPHEQLEIVADALKGRDLEAVYLSPAARKILQAGPSRVGRYAAYRRDPGAESHCRRS